MFSEPDVDNGGWLNVQGFEGPVLPLARRLSGRLELPFLEDRPRGVEDVLSPSLDSWNKN
jgi:hypothetical protein